MVTTNTEIVLEGFPRSANTFALNLLRFGILFSRPVMFAAKSDTLISHHTHSVGNLKLALELGVPTFVLIRPPLDAIPSSVIRAEALKEKAFQDYVYYTLSRYRQFYNFVWAKKKKLTIISFETVTETPWEFLKVVNDQTNGEYMNLDEVNINRIATYAKRAIKIWTEKTREPSRGSPLPNEAKEQMKKQVRDHILSRYSSQIEELNHLYQKIVNNSHN